MEHMMKASVIFEFGGPDVLKYVHWSKPEAGEGQILVRNEAIGIGAWDAMWREGAYSHEMPDLPLVPGQISTGRVVAVGAGVGDVKVGDPVHVIALTGGTYADYVAVAREFAILLPEGLDPAVAACISDYRSAWAFFQDGLQGLEVKTVFLPHAAGGVGMALVQVAKILGYQVVATAGSDRGCEMLSQWGADLAINYRTENVTESLLEFTGGEGAQLIFDHVAGEEFATNFTVLAAGGMVFILNERGGASTVNPFQALREHADKGWKIRSWSMHIYDRHQARREELVAQVMDMLLDGRLKPEPLNRMPLSQAAAAHALRAQQRLPGKTVLIP